jgi:large subunit ribosomal protein L32
MAVPKKRTSKSKRDIRKFQWKQKASFQAKKALSIALSLLKKRSLIKSEEEE